MDSRVNTVIVAIMQIGVVVAGVFGAAVCHKFWTNSSIEMPQPTLFLYQYGWMGFLIPLVWSFWALRLICQPYISDELKNIVFGAGVLLLLAMVVFAIFADVIPWFRIMVAIH